MARRSTIQEETFEFDEDEHGLTVALFDAVFIGLMENKKIQAEPSDLREHAERLVDILEDAVEKAIDDSDLTEEGEGLYLDGIVQVTRTVMSQLDEKDLRSEKIVVNTVFEYANARWEGLNDILSDEDDDDEEELN